MKALVSTLLRLLVVGQMLIYSGCGILFGNIGPVEERAENYTVLNLAHYDPNNWSRIPDESSGDYAFQAKSISAAISIISSCREGSRAPSAIAQEIRLRNKSDELIRGMTDITFRRERPRMVSDIPALETTVVGKMAAGPEANQNIGTTVLQSVVLQKNQCSYEFVSVSSPDAFEKTQSDFSRFVQSFRISEN